MVAAHPQPKIVPTIACRCISSGSAAEALLEVETPSRLDAPYPRKSNDTIRVRQFLDGDCSAIGAGTPQHVACAAIVDPPAENEEVVREAVQVFERLGVYGLGPGELADQALGPPRYRASEMEVGGGRRPARQDKRVERPQRRVYRVALAFEALDLGRGDAQCSSRASALFRGAQVGAEVEEVVLNAAEHFVCRRIGMQPGDSDRRICFVDGAIGGDAQCVLRDARTVAERGLAGITAARIDPSQSNHLRRKRLRG